MSRLLTAAILAAAILAGGTPAVSGFLLRHSARGADADGAREQAPSQAADEVIQKGSRLIPELKGTFKRVLGAPRKALALIGLVQKPETEGPHTEVDQGVDDTEANAQFLVVRALVGLVSVVVYVGLTCLIAQYYQSNKIHPAWKVDASSAEALSSFKFGPFDCLSRPDISLWVCCCPAIRWADNISTIGSLRSFWLAFTVILGFHMVEAEAQDVVAWCILALIGAGFRSEMRLKFQMARNNATFFQDCLLYACCACCAITQEARQLEEAMRMGHPAVVKNDEAAA